MGHLDRHRSGELALPESFAVPLNTRNPKGACSLVVTYALSDLLVVRNFAGVSYLPLLFNS